MYRQGFRLLIGMAWVVLLATTAAAEEQKPEDVLAEKGLRKLSSHFALPEETELGKQVREASQRRRKLLDALRDLADCEEQQDNRQQLIIAYLQKRRELRTQLLNAPSTSVHNRLVIAMNELADRIVLLQEQDAKDKSLETARATANGQTQQYAEHLLRAQQLYDRITKQYEELAADESVEEAIEQFSESEGKTYQLGPTLSFLSHGRTLKRLADAVSSESIPLRRRDGALWYVSATFNGQHTVEMVIDTGASLVALPREMADQLGLTPGANDPPVQLQMADGRTIVGRRVVAKSIRVGKFTAEDVECAVLPADANKGIPLLGLSFLGNFVFQIDTANSKLILSKVETRELDP